jgi:hypothetical protein
MRREQIQRTSSTPAPAERRRTATVVPLPTRTPERRRHDPLAARVAELDAEIERLREVCRRRELAMDVLVKATMSLRRGTAALREENRELRRQMIEAQRR